MSADALREALAGQAWAKDWPHSILPPSKPAMDLALLAIRTAPGLLATLDTQAAKIAELEAENARMREALVEIELLDDETLTDADLRQPDRHAGFASGVRTAAKIARAALTKGPSHD